MVFNSFSIPRLVLALGLTSISSVQAASLQTFSGIPDNPTNIQIQIYVPDKLAANPAILLNLHGCMSNGQQQFQRTKYSQLADQHGFIVLYPSARQINDNCWDVHSTQSLTRNGGGDSQGLAGGVKHAAQKYGSPADKLFVIGTSSGGMMTNSLLALYPDVFSGGASFSGVPYSCLSGSPASSPQRADPTCANGQINKTPQQWGDLVRNAFPRYNGTRPKVQIWHGTADGLVRYQNMGEQLEMWSDVLGVQFVRNVTNSPKSGYTEMVYGDGTRLKGYSAQGVGHTVPEDEQTVLKWFGVVP